MHRAILRGGNSHTPTDPEEPLPWKPQARSRDTPRAEPGESASRPSGGAGLSPRASILPAASSKSPESQARDARKPAVRPPRPSRGALEDNRAPRGRGKVAGVA